MVGVGTETLMSYTPMTLTAQTGGKVTASFANGEVLSIQPNGSHERRPKGTVGPFELATVDGKTLVYAYTWMGNPYVHVVPLLPTLPVLA
jgi:hypothetical protein